MAYLSGGKISRTAPHHIEIDLGTSALKVEALEPWLIRTSWAKKGAGDLSTSWMVDPRENPPAEGRRKDDLSPFSCPPFSGSAHQFELLSWRVTLLTSPKLGIELETLNADGLYTPACRDRETGAYWATGNGAAFHYQAHDDDHRIYGLGDKTGPLNKSNRRYRILPLDALGYDPDEGDPLYKHIPVLLHRTKAGTWYGEIYDSLSQITLDLGLERSNYHGRYRSIKIDEGSIDRYMIAGPSVDDVVKRISWLCGRPALMPRWSLGLALTSMHHMDAPNPEKEMVDCIDAIAAAKIPLSAYHLSSGYQLHDGKRLFFVWDKTRIPDPQGMIKKALDRDIHLSANIKPVILTSHPKYAECVEKKLFITDEAGEPVVETFWTGDGSFLDFTAPACAQWWKENVINTLHTVGIESAWNDNNEHEIFSEGAQISNFGESAPSAFARPVHALLMDRASYEASLSFAPQKRPFGVTRAGPLGIQRYCQTWTGDNLTDWRTLHGDLRQVLGMALCGISNIGFDIGGFAGPSPGPELLTRWFQLMAMMPRFFINGWNTDEIVTTPVMHPEAIPPIRQAVELRYRLLPTLYTAHVLAHETGLPQIRPLFYEGDDNLLDEGSAFFAAEHLISAPALFEGQNSRIVRLPNTATGWTDLAKNRHISGAEPISVSCGVNDPLALFARTGSALLLARNNEKPRYDDPDEIILIPTSKGHGTVTSTHYRDDGITRLEGKTPRQIITVRVDMHHSKLHVALTVEGDYPCPARGFRLIVPHDDSRPISLTLNGVGESQITIDRHSISNILYLGT